MAVPSPLLPEMSVPLCPDSTVTFAGKSPVATALVRWYTLSDKTPIFMPAPVTPNKLEAVLTPCA